MAKVTKKKSVANKETSQTSEKIQRTDTLGKVIEENPEIAPLLMQAGLHCIGCHVSAYESIQDGCASHGMND